MEQVGEKKSSLNDNTNNDKAEERDNDKPEDHDVNNDDSLHDDGGEEESVESDESEEGSEEGEEEEDPWEKMQTHLDTLSSLYEQSLSMARRHPDGSCTESFRQLMEEIGEACDDFHACWWELDDDQQSTATERLLKSGVIDLLCDLIVEGLGSDSRTSTMAHSLLCVAMDILDNIMYNYIIEEFITEVCRRVRDDGRLLPVLLETLRDWYRPHMDNTATEQQDKILRRSLEIIYNTARLDDTDTADRLCQLGTTDVLGKYLQSADRNCVNTAKCALIYIVNSTNVHLLCEVIVEGLGSHNRTSSDYTTTHSPLGAMYVLADTFRDTRRHRELWCRVRDDRRLLPVLLETLRDWYQSHMDNTATAPQNEILTWSLWIIFSTARLDDTDTADRLCQLGIMDVLGNYLKSADRNNVYIAHRALGYIVNSSNVHLLCDVIVEGVGSHNRTDTFIDVEDDIINPELWCRVRDDGRLLPVLLATLRDCYRPHMDNTATAPQNKILRRSLKIIYNTARLDDTDTADRLCQLGTTDVLVNYLKSADDDNVKHAALALRDIVKEQEAAKLASGNGFCTTFCEMFSRGHVRPAAELTENTVICRVLTQEGSALSALVETVRQTDDTGEKWWCLYALRNLCENQLQSMRTADKEEIVELAVTQYRSHTGTDLNGLCRDMARDILKALRDDLQRTPQYRQLCIELGFHPVDGGTGGRKRKLDDDQTTSDRNATESDLSTESSTVLPPSPKRQTTLSRDQPELAVTTASPMEVKIAPSPMVTNLPSSLGPYDDELRAAGSHALSLAPGTSPDPTRGPESANTTEDIYIANDQHTQED